MADGGTKRGAGEPVPEAANARGGEAGDAPVRETPTGGSPGSAPSETDALEQERKDLHAKWLRALADLDNYRKRTERDKCRWSEQARVEVLSDLLCVMDDLDRALASCGDGDSAAGLRDGVELIRKRLQEVLVKHGVAPIETEGAEFDPALHEAVCQVESNEHETNAIVSETQRGYKVGDRLLRCSKVVVAK